MIKKFVCVCLLIAIIAVMSVGLIACDGDGDYFVQLDYPNVSDYMISHTGSANSAAANIVINWGKGGVQVKRSDAVEYITFQEDSLSPLSSENSLHWISDGEYLRLMFCRAGNVRFESDFAKDLTVLIPSDKALNSISVNGLDVDVLCDGVPCTDLDVYVKQGSVDLRDCASNVHVNAHSARVNVSSSIFMDSLRIDSENSPVTVDVYDIKKLVAATTSGAISATLRGDSDSVELSSSGGSLTAVLHVAPAQFHARTETSGLFVKVADESGFQLTCSAKIIVGTLNLINLGEGRYRHGVGDNSMILSSDSGTVFLDPIDAAR